MNKAFSKMTVLLLIGMMVYAMTLTTLAQTQPIAPTGKEEVVYGALNPDGSVSGIYVVNRFNLSEPGTIFDYGDYREVKNINTLDPIYQDGNRITIAAGKGELYYQGTLNTLELPWRISIQYILDGQTLSADEVAGKSGELEIQMAITQNTGVDPSFFHDFALQVSLTLDACQCSHIVADGATMTNVGSNRQLSYIVLPGKEKILSIKANVTDFSLGKISINGIHLSLDWEYQEWLGPMDQLVAATRDIDDGAKASFRGADGLKEGISRWYGGTDALYQGIVQMQNGLDQLNETSGVLTEGSAHLLSALQQMEASLNQLSVSAEDISELVTISADIKDAIDQLAFGNAALPTNISYETYAAAMASGGLHLSDIRAGNDQSISALSAVAANLPANDSSQPAIQAAIAMLQANSAVMDGTPLYFDAITPGISSLSAGASALQENYVAYHTSIEQLAVVLASLPANMPLLKQSVSNITMHCSRLDAGIGEYTDGIAALAIGYEQLKTGAEILLSESLELVAGSSAWCDGSAELADATGKLREETSVLVDRDKGPLNQLLGTVSGENENDISFVSPSNTNVKFVQFVMQTNPIEIQAAIPMMDTPKEKLNFWQKLLRLGGWY